VFLRKAFPALSPTVTLVKREHHGKSFSQRDITASSRKEAQGAKRQTGARGLTHAPSHA
jgi:hypothetical protein